MKNEIPGGAHPIFWYIKTGPPEILPDWACYPPTTTARFFQRYFIHIADTRVNGYWLKTFNRSRVYINLGESKMRWTAKSEKDPHAWKPFFCLLPRKINGVMVWLERVERRWIKDIGGGWHMDYYSKYEYRLPSKRKK